MIEDDTIKLLSSWYKSYGWKVLQNKKNDNNNPEFHVTGESIKKPDIIGITPLGYKIVQEVKTGEKSLPLRQGSKLLQYFTNYHDGKTTYLDETFNPMKIDYFVIATNYSPAGHLKRDEAIRQSSQNHYNSYIAGRNPKEEYGESFELIRGSIWEPFKTPPIGFGYYKKYADRDTGIGAVLSTILDGDSISKPSLFIMRNHPTYNGTNSTWWHQWYKHL